MKIQQQNYNILLEKIADFDARTIAVNLSILDSKLVIDNIEVKELSEDLLNVLITSKCGQTFNKKLVKNMPLLF